MKKVILLLLSGVLFGGTRPEVEKYVAHYTDEMKATLLLPAGVTSRASIEYKDEDKLLESAENADQVYKACHSPILTLIFCIVWVYKLLVGTLNK